MRRGEYVARRLRSSATFTNCSLWLLSHSFAVTLINIWNSNCMHAFHRSSCDKCVVFPSKIAFNAQVASDLRPGLPRTDLVLWKAIKTQSGRGGWLLVPELLPLSMCRHARVSFWRESGLWRLTAVALHQGHSRSGAFNPVFTLASPFQIRPDNATRTDLQTRTGPDLPSLGSMPGTGSKRWRLEQAALRCNWVPRHLEIHVSLSHVGYWAKWHQCPTSWVHGWIEEKERKKYERENVEGGREEGIRWINAADLRSSEVACKLWTELSRATERRCCTPAVNLTARHAAGSNARL